jgi:hypothetical protein
VAGKDFFKGLTAGDNNFLESAEQIKRETKLEIWVAQEIRPS